MEESPLLLFTRYGCPVLGLIVHIVSIVSLSNTQEGLRPAAMALVAPGQSVSHSSFTSLGDAY